MRNSLKAVILLVGSLALGLGITRAQQPNSPEASLLFQGIDGAPYPIMLPINTNAWGAVLEMAIAGGQDQPFTLVSTPAGVLQAGFPTSLGFIDLDTSQGTTILLDGLGAAPLSLLTFFANTGPSGVREISFPMSPALVNLSEGLQVLMTDPTSAGGLKLSAATHLSTFTNTVNAVYVSYSLGAQGNPGTSTEPFLTVQQGINASLMAGAPHPMVMVEIGTYNEAGLTLHNGVSVTGGLDPISWQPPVNLLSPSSIVNVATTPATATDIDQPTNISDFQFNASNTTTSGTASIAMRIENCDGNLTFTDCIFVAGRGAHGSNGGFTLIGISGADGASGASGGAGGNALLGGFCGGTGGNGGSAGGTGSNGARGCPLFPFPLGGAGGSGGGAGALLCFPNSGSTGTSGADGLGGAAGVQAPFGGVVDAAGFWSPGVGTNGGNGTSGRGGGGGGGGGGSTCSQTVGGHGGGGGQGGRFGRGGANGQSGGASIAVHVHASSPIFTDCALFSRCGGDGGNGANGGAGGLAGLGGAGEPGSSGAGSGGSGGNGGGGGGGGGGAGGHGGPSIALFKSGGSLPVLVSTNLGGFFAAPSLPGQGGPAGSGQGGAPNGAQGPSGTPGIVVDQN